MCVRTCCQSVLLSCRIENGKGNQCTDTETHMCVCVCVWKENIFQNHSISYHTPGKHENGVENLINECIFISGCVLCACALHVLASDGNVHCTQIEGNSSKRINYAAVVHTYIQQRVPSHTLCSPSPNKQFYYNFIHRF